MKIKFYILFCLSSLKLSAQEIPLDELVSLQSLPLKRADSLLRVYSFIHAGPAKDTLFYDYQPVGHKDGLKKYRIFKVREVLYYKGDFIYPRSFIKNLKNPDIDEFDDRTFWHFLYKEHYISLKFDKRDKSFLLRIAKL